MQQVPLLSQAHACWPRCCLPPLASVKSDAELAALKDEKDEEKTKELAFVVPRMLKTLVGAGHIDFSTGQQQDAADYLLHFLDKINL